MTLIGAISKALDEDRFELYVEDVVSLRAPHEIVYRELLLRMRDEQGRIIAPSRLIAAAERYYLMNAIDRWVVSRAIEAIARLPSDGVIYAINLSAISLSDEQFLPFVQSCLEQHGAPPERICFEITETAAISHLTEAVKFIQRLADEGCRFALDDFGAGMASFSYLRNLPVHFLKIDGSFVRSMQDSDVDRSLVTTINQLGHDVGLRTIAEHVEDVSVIRALQEIGVDWAQGRAIAEARPFSELFSAPGEALTQPSYS